MKFHTDRIQALIAEIDNVLGKSRKSGLGWFKSGEEADRRRVLERVRNSLDMLQQEFASTSQVEIGQTTELPLAGEMALVQAPSVDRLESLAIDSTQKKTPQEILQAVVEEMAYLRTFYERAKILTELTQQCQADLEALQQKRQALRAEIEQLEQQRQNYLSQQQGELKQKTSELLLDTETTSPTQQSKLWPDEEAEPTATQIISPQIPNILSEGDLPLPYAGAELVTPNIQQWERSIQANQQAEATNTDESASKENDSVNSDYNILDIVESSPPACRIEDAPQFREVAPAATNRYEIAQDEEDFARSMRSTDESDRIAAADDRQLVDLESTDIVSFPQDSGEGTGETSAWESTDTIAALTDLIDETARLLGSDSLEDELLSEPISIEEIAESVLKSADTEAESYLPASPEEDLLSTDRLEGKSNVDLWVGKNMLEQLSQDLSGLEGLDSPQVQEESDILQRRDNSEQSAIERTQANRNTQPTATASAYQIASSDNKDEDAPVEQETASQREAVLLNIDETANSSSDDREIEDLTPQTEEKYGLIGSEEIPCTIPEEILAEFDDLFGESLETELELPVAEPDSQIDPLSLSRPNQEEVKKKVANATELTLSEDWESKKVEQEQDEQDTSTLATFDRGNEEKLDEAKQEEKTETINFWQKLTPPPRIPFSRPSSFTPTPLPPLPPSPPPIWYLGIDFGTTGLSATLLNRLTRQIYPIAWSPAGHSETSEQTFRLPAAVDDNGILLRNFKPLLKIGLPYYCAQRDRWEPVLQVSSRDRVPLWQAKQALQALLTSLNPAKNEVREDKELEIPDSDSHLEPEILSLELRENSSFLDANSRYTIAAIGLEEETLHSALNQLAGAIVSCPAEWSEAYRFNVRESILGAGLVSSPDRICFVEEAIATFLAALSNSPYTEGDEKSELPSTNDSRQQTKTKLTWRGTTVILHTGATTTEIALVDLPKHIEDLTSADFTLRSFPYAGSYLDQDIICQLLLNPETISLLSITDSLGSKNLDLPLAGDPDLPTRYLWQQRLESTPFGKNLLASAQYAKHVLLHQESFTVEIGENRWVLRRQDLENRVFAPFIQRLNRELNTLLAVLGIPVEAIEQVICTGGTALLPSVSDWLRQKLPNATLIKDEGGSRKDPVNHSGRVALGLASLPLYTQVFDRFKQQYSEYFLLAELLRVFGEKPLPIGRIFQLLERRGINTQACQGRLLALLEGELPIGVVPSLMDADLLNQESWQNPVYQALTARKLFYKEDNHTYWLNSEQGDRLRLYLKALLEQTHQKLEEPYAVYWLAPTDNTDT
ncbi:hypothetical protein ACE1CD_28845 [Aerosakkonema sp. BLCC-F183]|uniref:hypothetical protein n=1 Tax=Aerosakkonema sp. BLCC-F183 TaxID=3342834 RepID=UPI0035B6E0F7